MNKLKRISAVSSMAVILVLAYSNCSSPGDNQSEQQSLNLPAHNYFKNPRPQLICGSSGYQYLMEEYFVRFCASCHKVGGFAQPTFVDADPFNFQIVYGSASFISEEVMKDSVLNNPFCGKGCSLDPRGEMYHGIEEWMNNPDCP